MTNRHEKGEQGRVTTALGSSGRHDGDIFGLALTIYEKKRCILSVFVTELIQLFDLGDGMFVHFQDHISTFKSCEFAGRHPRLIVLPLQN